MALFPALIERAHRSPSHHRGLFARHSSTALAFLRLRANLGRTWPILQSSVHSHSAAAVSDYLTPGGVMLFKIALVLFVVWLLGVLGLYHVGQVFHLLFLVAFMLALLGLARGRDAALGRATGASPDERRPAADRKR